MSDTKVDIDTFDSVCVFTPSSSKVYHHKAIFNDFKKVTEDYPNGEELEGDEFKIPVKCSSLPCHIAVYPSGNENHIEVYPSGNEDGSVGWMSVYLFAKPTDDMDFKMSVEWSIINTIGEKVFVKSDSEGHDNSVSVYEDSWGEQHFIKLTDIFNPNNNLLKNGSLTLACKITIFQADVVKKSNQFAENREGGVTNNHFSFMNRLLENPADFGSDFIIECSGNEEVKCHIGILAAKSEVFEVRVVLRLFINYVSFQSLKSVSNIKYLLI